MSEANDNDPVEALDAANRALMSAAVMIQNNRETTYIDALVG